MALLHHSFTKMSVGEADFHASLGAPPGACNGIRFNSAKNRFFRTASQVIDFTAAIFLKRKKSF
jgi:hypothetical protein